MVLELDWLWKIVNNMLIDTDWLSMLLDRGENKVTSFKLTKYDFAYLDTLLLFSWTGHRLEYYSWTKTDMTIVLVERQYVLHILSVCLCP